MPRHCPLPLGPDALMALAREQTGITIDDEAAREPLRVLHRSISEEGPLFVIGSARTGTTKTQKCLADTGDFNFLPFWKAYNPALFSGERSESPQARIDEADAYCTWFDRQSPLTKTGHSFETHEPEEETEEQLAPWP